ncbi:MAG: hypothetical protein EA366_11715 [Spirulina sp. DLM2.Bin59]|nr:MAG: hypothetical protein EA366_11715 [Spirulina sp. DLM2.Bin59]
MLKHSKLHSLVQLDCIQLLTTKKIAMVLGLSLTINLSLNAEASESYLTEQKIQQSRSSFSYQTQEVLSGDFMHYVDDQGTDLKKQKYQNFVNNLLQVDSVVTPFLKQQSFESDQSPLVPITSDLEVETILKLIYQPIMNIWAGSRISSYFVDGVAIVNNYAMIDYGVGQNGGGIVLRKSNGQWSVLTSPFYVDLDTLIRAGVPRSTASALITKIEQFRRQRTEQQELKQFQQIWSQVNPSVAQFLGYWQADVTRGTSSVSVYPSLVPNQVCVVRFSGFNSRMEIGQVLNNRITTPTTSFTYFANNSPFPDGVLVSDAYEYIAFPQPLNTWHFSEDTIRDLNRAQCTLSPK